MQKGMDRGACRLVFFFLAFVLGIWKSFRLSGAGVVAKLLGEEGFSELGEGWGLL